MSQRTRRGARSFWFALALVALTAVVYGDVLHFGFVNWDDYANGSSAAAVELAQLDEALGHASEAESGYRRALELDPLEETALLRLGTIVAGRGDLEGAQPLVRKLAQLSRQGWTVGATSREVGLLAVRVELWPQAQYFLEQVVLENPGDADAWSFVGLARQRQHLFGPSIDAYEHALRIAPQFVNARFNLGVACLQSGNFDCARTAYDDLRGTEEATANRLNALIQQEQAKPR